MLRTSGTCANGLDCVPGAVLKSCSKECARLYFPLVMKYMLCVHEPLQWKSSRLADLYKGRGLPN
eukprot:3235116-Pyramimonas_sp.AAC.1